MNETYRQLAIHFKETKDEKTFNKLYARIKPGLTNYIYNIVKDREAANDIVSDTLTKLYTLIDTYNPQYEVTTWLYRIAKNDAIHFIYYRNSFTSLNAFADKGYEAIDSDDLKRFGGKSLSIDESYQQTNVEKEHLEKEENLQKKYNICVDAINSLKPKYRQIMMDRFFGKMAYQDIEAKINNPIFEKIKEIEEDSNLTEDERKYALKKLKSSLINLQTVKNRIHRGRKIIQEILGNHPIFCVREDI
jgi:RNA polymerase sigma factor (sigma-70 family)